VRGTRASIAFPPLSGQSDVGAERAIVYDVPSADDTVRARAGDLAVGRAANPVIKQTGQNINSQCSPLVDAASQCTDAGETGATRTREPYNPERSSQLEEQILCGDSGHHRPGRCGAQSSIATALASPSGMPLGASLHSMATFDSALEQGMARGYGCARKRTPPSPSRPG